VRCTCDVTSDFPDAHGSSHHFNLQCAAKQISVESSSDDVPGHFTKLHNKSFDYSSKLQSESHEFAKPLKMLYVKLILEDGWAPFAAVKR
jgi:hypothetical protein